MQAPVVRPRNFGFLLVNEFTLMSMASAIEPLRMANRLGGDDFYRWVLLSEDGGPVTASDGIRVAVDHGIGDSGVLGGLDIVILCGGLDIERNASDALRRYLRHVDRQGIALGGICTGSVALALAGVLDGYRCSVHWENLQALTDRHPKIIVARSIYTIDRDRLTASGGTAPVDLMLHLIREQRGDAICSGVAEQFIYERIRRPSDEQRVPLKHIVGNQSEKLIATVQLMEANVSEPIVQEELAAYIGITRRQLQRLFQRYLKTTPSRYYLRIRLERARHMLRCTDMTIVDIASQTGFASNSHFSKCFRLLYGYAPSLERTHDRRRA